MATKTLLSAPSSDEENLRGWAMLDRHGKTAYVIAQMNLMQLFCVILLISTLKYQGSTFDSFADSGPDAGYDLDMKRKQLLL